MWVRDFVPELGTLGQASGRDGLEKQYLVM